jgi:hypothetical protein
VASEKAETHPSPKALRMGHPASSRAATCGEAQGSMISTGERTGVRFAHLTLGASSGIGIVLVYLAAVSISSARGNRMLFSRCTC